MFGKYLVALSVSLGNSEDEKISRSDKQSEPSIRRKQLHILYLLNDLLHHTKYHLESSSVHSTLTANIQSHLINLIGTTSAYDPRTFEKHHHKIQDLLNVWVDKSYFDPFYIQTLRETVDKSLKNGLAASELGSSRLQRDPEEVFGEQKVDAPFIMPSTHGDTSTPYYDLPAGNMMPHIIPNSATPINPQILRPLQFMGGPAEETLVTALKDFMREIGPIVKTEHDDTLPDTDELGNIVVRDVITGELITGEGYYGWSSAFCEKMKRRRNGTDNAVGTMGGDQRFGRSSSPRKRRRYSYSESSRDWDRDRSRSRTASPSSSAGYRRASRHSSRTRSYSRSRSVSRAKRLPRHTEYNTSRARSGSRSRSVSKSESYSPPPNLSKLQPNLPTTTLTSPPVMVQAQGLSGGSRPPFPQAFNQGFSLGPGVLPIPPPPPPNYQGPWPPPPPPLPPASHPNMSSAGNSYAAFPPFAPPPPSGLNHVNPGPIPINHGTWSQQSPRKSGNYPYSGSASTSSAFRGPSEDHRSGPKQGGW